jgi:hypothetical protein
MRTCPTLIFTSVEGNLIIYTFIGLGYQGKDIVLRFIREDNSLRDFGLLGNNRSIFIQRFLKDDILACVET